MADAFAALAWNTNINKKKVGLGVAAAAAATTMLLVARARKNRKPQNLKRVPEIVLDWSYSPAQITRLGRDIIKQWKALDDDIAAQEAPTFESTFARVIALDRELDPIENAICFPKHVSPDEKVREAAKAVEKELVAFGVESSMRRDVYLVLKKAADAYGDDDATLSEEEKRFMEKRLVDYERNGMSLAPEAMKEVEALKKELADLSTTFSTNIAEDDSKHLVTAAELEGCSEAFIEGLEKDPGGSGKLVLTMAYPHVMAVGKTCKVSATRAAMEAKFNSRCKASNVALLEKICELRHDIATKLGFPSHAHYRLELRMARTPGRVTEFLGDLARKLGPLAEKELKVMQQLKAEAEGGGGDNEENPSGLPVINMWDYRYYMNMVEEKFYQVDHEVLRQYFPFDTVLQGMLSIYRDTFGLDFEEITHEAQRWHEDVLVFKVKQHAGRDSRLLGYFYLDLWPRPNKFSHAACWPLQSACTLPSGERRPAVTALVCNFPAPKEDGTPPLLEHNEVTTFFHEFGHGVHNLCSMAEIPRFAGTSVERDFVEAPSQMLENWCWEVEPLERLSRHVETGESIPAALVEKLIAAKNANVGLLTCRQLFFGIFDQTIHSRRTSSTAEVLRELHTTVMRVPMTPGTNFAGSFGHMCGYDAQYYGYMWSEVFSDDMFMSRFKADPLSRRAGQAYCDMVLAKGGSQDADDMLRNFLGREPNQAAFLRAKGLKVEDVPLNRKGSSTL